MNKKKIYYWLLLPVLALMMGACSESNKNEEPAKPDTPVTPVDPGDWQTVPAAGGTITKGDIALTFPAGTFSSDTKVAITEVKKGEMGGDLEASPFYQITMPATTAKPLTVSVTCADTDEDIRYVIRMPGWATSSLKKVQHDSYLETEYADGKYTTTLPVFDNGNDPGNESFTIGLGHVPNLEKNNARNTTRGSLRNKVIASGTVEGVTWELYISWDAWWKWMNTDTLNMATRWNDEIGKNIEAAIKQIHQLGFELGPKTHTIPYYYDVTNDWGTHCQSYDWLSCILLNTSKIAKANTAKPLPTGLKQAIIHETFHFYQSFYDPRYYAMYKGGDNDHLIMWEMGAVWIEKYMNEGQLSADFQLDGNGLSNCVKNNYRLGVPLEKDDILGLFPTNQKNAYQQQGYSLAPLLYYMINKYMKEDSDIWNLYSDWRKELYKYYPVSTGGVLTTVELLENWFKNKHGSSFFNSSEFIDDYYLSLFNGKVIKGVNFFMISGQQDGRQNTISKSDKLNFPGKVFPSGCEGTLIKLVGFKDSIMADYEIVVKQEAEGVHTYLLYYNARSKAVVEIPSKAIANDSIVFSCEDFESLKSNGGKLNVYIFLLTTRNNTSVYDKGTVPTNTWFELRKPTLPSIKASPTELTFEAEGGQQTVRIDKKSYRYCGGITGDCEDWITIKNVSDGVFTVTAAPNTTDKERTGTIYAFATNSMNPTKDDIVLLPIKVKQKAGDTSGDTSQQQQITQVEISSFKFKTGLYANCTQNHYNENGKLDKTEEYVSGSSFEGGYMDQSFTAENITSSFSGSTLHVKAEYEYRGQKYDVSFDVTGITGDYKEARVTSLTCKRVISESVFGHEKYNFTATYSNIPVNKIGKKSASDPLSLSRMTFEGTPANGMGISGYSCEKYTYDGWGGYTHYHFDYLDNAANFATLVIEFKSVK